MARQARQTSDLETARIRARALAVLAWSVWAICVALVTLAVLLVLNTPPVSARGGPNLDVLAGVPFLAYATVGAFFASRRPKNAAGWVLCGMGLVFAFEAFAGAYADYALVAACGPWCGWRSAARRCWPLVLRCHPVP
jgi:hypothetical protein